ncbi:hypothetical protein V8E54_001317 [Elaphomyces granulatus]
MPMSMLKVENLVMHSKQHYLEPSRDKNADVNAQGGFFGNAPQIASASGHQEIVELLLGKNVDVNASRNGRGEIVELLRMKPWTKSACTW